MNKSELFEIKKGKVGTGLLIENDGYISMSDEKNRQLKESINSVDGWHCPYPFVVHAVFQKYGIKNANGRIYPESVLKKQVELYQQRIKDKRALGECYTPDVLVLTESGWKQISEIKEGENILTLNTITNEIEIHPIIRKIEYDYEGDMVHIKGRNIDDLVTPNHGYPIYNRYNTFHGFYTAEEIYNKTIKDQAHSYIPKQGTWTMKGDNVFILKGISNASKALLRKNPDVMNDKEIPMSTFMKFLGIYLSEGDYRKTNNDVNIYQKKANICDEILEMLKELDLHFTYYKTKDDSYVFRICDLRLKKFVESLGDCYTKYIPTYFKNQSKENLTILYDWFVKGDGRLRGDKRRGTKLSDDVFSTSKQLILDLNEIQLKIGYSGNFHTEDRSHDRYFGTRLIEGKNCHDLHFSLRSLTKGIYLDDRFLTTEKEYYQGKVMCLEVQNNTFYVMSNNKCHWSKNCNHPAESTVDLGRISHNITELHWEGRTLVGQMELNITKGFVEQGICWSLGDTVANLLLNGYKIGVSSRGVGSVEQKLGQYIVGDDFELICWDVVADPSTANAYIGSSREELQPYLESKNYNNKTNISEKIDKIKNILEK